MLMPTRSTPVSLRVVVVTSFVAFLMGGLLFFTLSLYLTQSPQSLEAATTMAGGYAFPWARGGGGSWGERAAANLTRWQAEVFARTSELYAQQPFHNLTLQRYNASAEPKGWARYSLMDPFIGCPEGDVPQRTGLGDGGKFLCLQKLAAPCTIISAGSRNDYSFEEAMLQTTPCNVVTLDCTVEGWSIDDGERHSFLKLCLGSAKVAAERPAFITWTTLMGQLGIGAPEILKIDIEGFEWDIFASWADPWEAKLPRQIAVELHWAPHVIGGGPEREMRLAELMLYAQHMAVLGYGIASREDNVMSKICSEFLLLRTR